MNFKKKLYLINFLTVIVPIIIISITTYIIFSREIKKLEDEKIDLINKSIKETIINSIDSMDEMLDYIVSVYIDGDETLRAINKKVDNKNRQWRMLRHMNNLADIESTIKFIGYGNIDKKIYFNKKAKIKERLLDYDPTKEEWYIKAINSENYYLSNIFIDPETNEPTMTISRKIVSEGKIAGIVYFSIDVNKIIRNMSRYKIGKNGSFFIINKNKEIVIYSERSQKNYRYIYDMDLYNLDYSKNNHFEITRKTPEGKILYHLYKLDKLGLVIVANVGYDDFYSSVYILRNFCIAVVLISIIGALISLWVFGKKFDKSLNRLSYVINSISDGNYTKNIDKLTKVIDKESELNFIKESIKTMNYKIIKREKNLKFIAETDSLTKIYNRRAIISFIEVELEQSKSFDLEFVLIMIDFDKFKRLNDKFGHLFGDEVLKKVCKKLLNNIGKTDRFGRYGGEEFLILLPNTKLIDGITVANRLREIVKTIKWEKETEVTISIGVIISMKNDTLETVLERVDNLLYEAKNNGRDRVEYQKV